MTVKAVALPQKALREAGSGAGSRLESAGDGAVGAVVGEKSGDAGMRSGSAGAFQVSPTAEKWHAWRFFRRHRHVGRHGCGFLLHCKAEKPLRSGFSGVARRRKWRLCRGRRWCCCAGLAETAGKILAQGFQALVLAGDLQQCVALQRQRHHIAAERDLELPGSPRRDREMVRSEYPFDISPGPRRPPPIARADLVASRQPDD
jgi:hypothetical protein